MKIVFLGTSAALPTQNRNTSCVCLVKDGEVLMFDAGEGTQLTFQKSSIGWNKKMKIFITHMHGDHCIGLLGLLQTMTLKRRSAPLEIYGPIGIRKFLKSYMSILNFATTFPMTISEIIKNKTIQTEKYSISCCKAKHTVLAFSYLFKENDKQGKFNAKKADKLGVPNGAIRGKLKNGENVKINGRLVRSSELVGPSKKGIWIGISGDTRPTKELEKFFDRCDYLIFESTFGNESSARAKKTGHSTAKEAATLASNAGVKYLILTHFSARYKNVAFLVREAKTRHRRVVAAKDHMEIIVKNCG